MNWYEQKTNEYESITGKQILNEFGAAGYGIYIVLKQIIGQYMGDDQSTWGFVPPTETMNSLAQKCGTTEADFRLFIKFCDDRFILEKRDGRLFCPSILEEKSRYAKMVSKKIKVPTATLGDSVLHTVHTATQCDIRSNTTQHNTSTIIDKSIGSTEPKAEILKENKKNKCVDHAISEFTRVYKFQPTDKKVRNVAYNLVQRMQTVIKTKLGGDVSEERVMTGITRLFNWISRNESFSNIQKLETIKLKMSIWEANLKGSYAANERQNYSGESEQTPGSNLGGETRILLRRDRLPDQGQNNVLHSSVSGDATTRTSGSFEGMGQLLQKIKNDGAIETKRTRPDGVGELRLGDSIQNAQGGIEQTDGTARHDDRGIL